MANTIEQFATMLQGLAMVADDAPRAIALINTFPFSEEPLWQEAKESIAETEVEE